MFVEFILDLLGSSHREQEARVYFDDNLPAAMVQEVSLALSSLQLSYGGLPEAAATTSGENECVATSIRREVGISFGFTTTSWMNLVMENFFDFPLVTIIHSSRQNTIAIMACLWMLIAFYRRASSLAKVYVPLTAHFLPQHSSA